MITPKSPAEIELMAASGAIQARCLEMLRKKIRPGVTGLELDDAAEKLIRAAGGIPAFKGYRGFPGSICVSPNSMVVHGIPDGYKFKKGDIASIDAGVILDGWYSDAAITVPVGPIDPEAQNLLRITQESLFKAVDQCVVGNHLGDIASAVQTHAEAGGLSVIRELIGHGVGKTMHEEPQVPNFGAAGTGEALVEGTVIAIEPMLNVGGPGVRLASDDWAVFTQDGSLSAHFEFTVAVTADGPRILTPWHLQ